MFSYMHILGLWDGDGFPPHFWWVPAASILPDARWGGGVGKASPFEFCLAATPRLRVPRFQSMPSPRFGSCRRMTGAPHSSSQTLARAWPSGLRCVVWQPQPRALQPSGPFPRGHPKTSILLLPVGRCPDADTPPLQPPPPHGGPPHHVALAPGPALLSLTPSVDSLLSPAGLWLPHWSCPFTLLGICAHLFPRPAECLLKNQT